MDKLKQYQGNLTGYNFFWIFITALFSVGTYMLLYKVFNVEPNICLAVTITVCLAISYGAAKLLVLANNQPLVAIWQAVWHLSPTSQTVPAPAIHELTHGREIADSLVKQIYALASNSQSVAPISNQSIVNSTNPISNAAPTGSNGALLDLIPLPVVALDGNGSIVCANKLFANYVGLMLNEIAGKSLENIMLFTLPGDETLDSWLDTVKLNTVTADTSWDRVRIRLAEDRGVKQCDMVAHFSLGNPAGYDTLLALFDHTDKYNDDDSNTSYVALAVHELRTPLTVLRGYIEVMDDELSSKLTPEMKDFMSKMSASAQTLTAFVSNILNVARIEENQLVLSLREANWNILLPEICKALELRAKVRGKTLQLDITPNLPTVAVDKISIYEVVSNLIENAIKYSGKSNKIIIHSTVTNEGNIETIVQDFGLGIPENSIKYLFTKFYRSHHSRSQVGGTGLGLYLVKAIITAHGGNVWVRSREGEGSSFGFTLKTFANAGNELKSTAANDIEHHAHGWIKNHSMSRK